MMKILTRYLARHFYNCFLTIGLIVTGFHVIFEFSKELMLVDNIEYTMTKAFIYCIIQLPFFLYRALSEICIISCAATLYLLSKNNELIAMRIYSLSFSKILKFLGLQIFLISCFFSTLYEVGASRLYEASNTWRAKQLHLSTSKINSQPVWLKEADNYIRIADIYSKSLIGNIQQYQYDKRKHLVSATFSNKGEFKQGKWHLKDNQLYTMPDKHNPNIEIKNISNLVLPTVIPKSSFLIVKKLSKLNLSELQLLSKASLLSKLQKKYYGILLWQKYYYPFLITSLSLLSSMIFYLSDQHNNLMTKLTLTICLSLTFHLTIKIILPLAAFSNLPPSLAAFFPQLVILIYVSLGLFIQNHNNKPIVMEKLEPVAPSPPVT